MNKCFFLHDQRRKKMNADIFSQEEIETRVSLEPDKLDKNYKEKLTEIVRKNFENTCLKNKGYIRKVVGIKEIVNEEIMKMIPNVYFSVIALVQCYIPKIGDFLDIHVDFVFNHGIFGGFEKIKVLIPIQSCEEWTLQQDFSALYLVHKTDSQKNIKKGQILRVEIKNIRFEKDNFSCLAKI